jgi:GNAT superfamily N-acetyltransferase
MLADLRTLENTPSSDASITICEVKNRQDLKIWKEVSFAGFDFPESTDRQYARFVESFHLNPDFPQHLFLACWNGKPAATSMVFLNENTAGIYFVTTLSPYRKKGIGLAITKETMRFAQNAGMHYVSLQSSPDGLHVYQQAGFKEYCQADIYSLSTTQES